MGTYYRWEKHSVKVKSSTTYVAGLEYGHLEAENAYETTYKTGARDVVDEQGNFVATGTASAGSPFFNLPQGFYLCTRYSVSDDRDQYNYPTTTYRLVSANDAAATAKYLLEISSSGGMSIVGVVASPHILYATATRSKGDFVEYVYSADSGAYPSDGESGGYWYSARTTVSSPGTPSSISYPTSIKGGSSVKISWGKATATVGTIAEYEVSRSINGGSYTVIYTGTSTSTNNTVAKGTTSVQYRVRAKDSNGQYGSYKTGTKVTVTNNTAPTISGVDGDLGSFSAASPSVDYTVNDADGNAVTVTVKLDDATYKTHTPVLGESNTFTFTSEEWLKILNGSHTLAITANDGSGGTAARQYTFTKSVTSLSFTLAQPLDADDMITKALESLTATIPSGAALKVEVCNNGYDASPTWQDVTARVLAGQKIFIENTTKTAANWGYNVRVTVERNGAAGDCFVAGMAGFFE